MNALLLSLLIFQSTLSIQCPAEQQYCGICGDANTCGLCVDSFRSTDGRCTLPKKKINQCFNYASEDKCTMCYPGFIPNMLDGHKTCITCPIPFCSLCTLTEDNKPGCLICQQGLGVGAVCDTTYRCKDPNTKSCVMLPFGSAIVEVPTQCINNTTIELIA